MSEPKVALVTGITGQDGSYLTELLLDKGYIVSLLSVRASRIGRAIGPITSQCPPVEASVSNDVQRHFCAICPSDWQ